MDKNTSDRIKEISVEILVDFDEFCKKNNLNYMLSFGTALGAVRHKGFIPWDDDVDVDMPIEDYLRLEKIWSKCGNKQKYFLQTKRTDPLVPVPFYRLRLNNTTWTEPNYEKYPIHSGIPIDIFAVYHKPNSKVLTKFQHLFDSLSQQFCSYPWRNKKTSGISVVVSNLLCRFFAKLTSIISDFSKNSELVFYPYGTAQRIYGEKKYMFPVKEIEFEGIKFKGPANPHEYLSWQYGDYMTPPPESDREGHPEGIIDLENDSSKYNGVLIRNK